MPCNRSMKPKFGKVPKSKTNIMAAARSLEKFERAKFPKPPRRLPIPRARKVRGM